MIGFMKHGPSQGSPRRQGLPWVLSFLFIPFPSAGIINWLAGEESFLSIPRPINEESRR